MKGKVEIRGSIWSVSVKATKGKKGVEISRFLAGKLCIAEPDEEALAALCADPEKAGIALDSARLVQGKVVIHCIRQTMFIRYREGKGSAVRASSREVTMKRIVYDAFPDDKGESEPEAELHYTEPFRDELLAFLLRRLGKEMSLVIEQAQGELALEDGAAGEKKGR